MCLADEGIEAVDEFAVAFGFAGPASGFGVSCEELGVGALRGEDGRVGVVGAVAGAVLADVGVGAGLLCGRAKAVAAGHARFDGGCFPPVSVADIDQGQGRAPGGSGAGIHRSDVGFGQVEGAFVFGADGAVEELTVAQTHLRGDMAEQRHERLQGHAGVDQRGGVSVAELVRGQLAQARGYSRPGEFISDRILAEPVAVMGEEEIGGATRPRVGQGPAGGPRVADAVEQVEGVVVEGHHAFGVEFAQRNFESGPIAGDLVNTVHFQIERFTDTQPALALQEKIIGGQPGVG